MPRPMYIVELDPIAIAQLQAAQALLESLVGNIQVVMMPDEEENDGMVEAASAAPDPAEPRSLDPQFQPPPPAPPVNNPLDFGAGPPP